MPYKHPYTLGSTGLIQVIQQLRKAFPQTVTAETLKKLGIAPNNESKARRYMTPQTAQLGFTASMQIQAKSVQ